MYFHIRRKQIGYWLFLFFFTLLAAEVLLRIYNPFPSSVIGDKIILTPNYSKIYKNRFITGDMDENIVYKRNSIGLRGPDPPSPFKDYLTIVTIGGSTTECMYISEGKTWQDQLSLRLRPHFSRTWINNAGFSGHSTFGHAILLRDYIVGLKPNICLFLVGANDIDRTDLRPHDKDFTMTQEKWILQLARKSMLVNTLLVFYRNHLAKEKKLAETSAFSLHNKEPLIISDSIIQNKIERQLPLVSAYATRLREMITLCKANGMEPILVTQPCLPGDTVDSVTGVNLATFPMSEEINGKLFWKYMELYNTETVRVAKQEGVLAIDLGNEMPKSSAYYYDLVHFNNSGNALVADIISTHLSPYLKEKYPKFFNQ